MSSTMDYESLASDLHIGSIPSKAKRSITIPLCHSKNTTQGSLATITLTLLMTNMLRFQSNIGRRPHLGYKYWPVHDFVAIVGVEALEDVEHFILPFSAIHWDHPYHFPYLSDLGLLLYSCFFWTSGIQLSPFLQSVHA